jgi:transposase
MDPTVERSDALLRSAAGRLRGVEHRLFIAEVTAALCEGNPRSAERRFGWGRETIQKGQHEWRSGLRCVENFAARGRPRWETENLQRAVDLRAIVEPHTQADPELKSGRQYTNLSAAEVLSALREQKNYRAEDLPSERSMRNILNRMNYRLKRIRDGITTRQPRRNWFPSAS